MSSDPEHSSSVVEQQQHHHVHFDQSTILKDEFETDNCVTYQKSGDKIVVVHLGFLQINHRYLIELKLPTNLFKTINDSIILVPDNIKNTTSTNLNNIHCKLIEFNGKKEMENSNEYYHMKVEYFAHQEKLLKEELKLIDSKNSDELLKLIMTARVLGKGKGTPMLRNGIHCIGVEHTADDDDESELLEFHESCSKK